jgi:hypothetical protein
MLFFMRAKSGTPISSLMPWNLALLLQHEKHQIVTIKAQIEDLEEFNAHWFSQMEHQGLLHCYLDRELFFIVMLVRVGSSIQR